MPLPLLFSREERAAHWNMAAPEYPYRASINGDAEWDFSRPLPDDLADAARITPGGRLLLAFRHAEVRDYFVEGHLDQGAKVERDGAEKATRPTSIDAKEQSALPTLDEAAAAVQGTHRAMRAAEDAVEQAFLVEAKNLLAEGRVKSALGIVKSIPGDCVSRTFGIDAAGKAGWDHAALPFDSIDKTPLTAERGRALLRWLRAMKADKAAEKALETLVAEPLEALIKAKDLDGAEALVERIKPSWTAVHADNALWDLRQERKAAIAAASEEPGDPDETSGGLRM
jgi:hypothetical protein